jgi:beta-aspartyl-peptidase (threonine type)
VSATKPCVVTHGGAGHDEQHKTICERACEAGARALAEGASARAAAIAAVRVLEDAPELNAGTGAVLRVDGTSVQCDAAVMDAAGFGAVAAVEGVRHPVQLAEAVYDLPHLLVVGDGASALADRLGLERRELLTEERRAQHRARLARRAAEGEGADAGIDAIFRLATDDGTACDTVGAVVRDASGAVAAAGSTGGLWCALRGRVGDTPIPGAGLDVDERHAVAATGVGEVIWRHRLSFKALLALSSATDVSAALDDVLKAVPELGPGVDLGLIAVGPHGGGSACTRRMPWAQWVAD